MDIELRRTPSYCVEGAADVAGGAELFISPAEPALGARRAGGLFTKLSKRTLDPSGAFRICDLAPGEYRITVYEGDSPGVTSFGRATFAIIDEDIRNLKVPLAPRIPLLGRTVWVGEPPDEPIDSEIFVQAWSLYESFGGPHSARTTIPGEFEIQMRVSLDGELAPMLMDDYRIGAMGLPESVYVADIDYAGESVLNRPLRLGSKRAGAELRVALAHDGGVLNVRVVDSDDKPVPGAAVIAIPKDVATHMQLADDGAAGVTDHRGEYTIPALQPGDYLVLATNGDFTDYAVETIAALFDARSKAVELTVGSNQKLDVTVEVVSLTR